MIGKTENERDPKFREQCKERPDPNTDIKVVVVYFKIIFEFSYHSFFSCTSHSSRTYYVFSMDKKMKKKMKQKAIKKVYSLVKEMTGTLIIIIRRWKVISIIREV